MVLSGSWRLASSLPSADELQKQIDTNQVRRIAFETGELKDWDSSLLTFLIEVNQFCFRNKIQLEAKGLPEGTKRLLKLATAVPEREGARRKPKKEVFLDFIGAKAILFWRSTVDMVNFLGEASVAFGRLLTGRAWFRRSDLVLLLQECGVQALPIVSLISVLVGLILAFVGAIELKMFGAQIYVADVVGIGMVRIMGAIMTGIIMAGRTGAAFCSPDRDDAGKRRDRCPSDPRNFTDGVSGSSANDCPHRDDAAALPLCRPDGDSWRHRGRDGHA